MLPDIVDGAIELVMQSQGPERRLTDPDDFLKAELPGQFTLIFDEANNYCYKGARKGKAGKGPKAKESAGSVKEEPSAAAGVDVPTC